MGDRHLIKNTYGAEGTVTNAEYHQIMKPVRGVLAELRKAVAKLHYLYETTESRATKYNLKRRIEEVLEDESGTYPQAKELAIWRNIQLKNSGLL